MERVEESLKDLPRLVTSFLARDDKRGRVIINLNENDKDSYLRLRRNYC